MGITERKKREKERRRNDIIDAAERVFFSKGRTLATMDDVAEEAELSKGTLYLYFKNKQDLYLAINLRGLKILFKMFEKAVKEHKTGITKVEAIGRAYFQFFKDYPDYFNALIYFESHEMNLNNEASTAGMCDMRGHETLDIFIKAIQTGIKDGTIRKNIDPLKTATILWGETSGLIQLIVTKGEQLANCHGVNTDELIDYSFELNMCSLKS